ncbi:MAG: hotdog fold thioesterase [Cytophagaceae bacterium]|nr:hotdog fold thioesterase [Cytophagaceae bacterium]
MKPSYTLDQINRFGRNTLIEHLGIEFLEISTDFLAARMPVDHRTHQPFGLLHGGASVALAESMGSMAGLMVLENPETQHCVGVEINANHLRSVTEGWVYGRCVPLHVGRRSHVWEIKISDEAGQLVCVSRITIMVVEVK